MKRQEYNFEIEVCTETYDPTITTVGEIAYSIWKENPGIFCSNIRIIYERNNPNCMSKRTTCLSNIFNRIGTYRHYKYFTKSILMRQFLILGVYKVQTVMIRGFKVYKLYITDRDSLYEVTCEEKRDYIANLFKNGGINNGQ